MEKFLIAPLKSGQQTNLKPWLIMDDAFETMRNAYTWRGRIKKRFGSTVMNESKAAPQDQLFSRLRVNLGMTDAMGDFAIVVQASEYNIGQMFSIGDEVFTVNALGNPSVLLTTGNSVVHTFDTTTGQLTITGADALTDVFFYPAFPVMGLETYEVAQITDEILLAFDHDFAYSFSFATGWNRLVGGADTWTGGNSDFFWATNYLGDDAEDYVLFITNNVPDDGFKFWNGVMFTQLGTGATTVYDPMTGDFIVTAKIIATFKNRLLLLNITENIGAVNIIFPNRIRYSEIGSPVAVDSWYQYPIQDKGGYLDLPVNESIISVSFIKDRMIIYCDNSTFELVFTDNSALPYISQKLNDELGVESMNSIVEFDKVSLGFGTTGIHACNGLNVSRIDDSIPDTIFDINNRNQGPQRVTGIRDYFIESTYWSFNSVSAQTSFNDIYPNRVLVFDYINKNWAYNDDSFTAFGLFLVQQNLIWDNLEVGWLATQIGWADGSSQSGFRSVIAGNQQGWTFIVDTDKSTNSISLAITDIAVMGNLINFTCIDHNLADGSYVFIDNIVATGGNMGDDNILNKRIFPVFAQTYDEFTIDVGLLVVTGVYDGGGVVQRVSEIVLDTKQYNFYNKEGLQVSVNKVDFLVDRTDNGQISVADYVSSSDVLNEAFILETSPYALVPLQQTQDRYWHAIYPNAYGEIIQFSIFFNNEQITNPDIAFSDFQINAMLFYVNPTSQF